MIEQLKSSGLWLVLIVSVLLSVTFANNTYYLYILGTIAVTTLVGVGLNVLTGLSGLVSIGHAGFFAIGAYTVSLLTTKLQWNFWSAAIAAVIFSAIIGAILAAPALRVTGPYLAMVTIAFGIIIERILVEWVSLTGGFGGIFNIPKPALFNLQPALRDVVLLAWMVAILALLSFATLITSGEITTRTDIAIIRFFGGFIGFLVAAFFVIIQTYLPTIERIVLCLSSRLLLSIINRQQCHRLSRESECTIGV